MITNLNGVLLSSGTDFVVVGVGGVGLKVHCGSDVLRGLGHSDFISLATTFIVRDDGMALYGFATESARDLFELLMTVSGIGAKVALSMLSTLGEQEIIRAINQGDTKTLASPPGIGAKGAARVIVDLSGKLPEYRGSPENATMSPTGGTIDSHWNAQLLAALEGLGWTRAQAQLAVAVTEQHVAAGADFDPDVDMSAALSFALRSLVKS